MEDIFKIPKCRLYGVDHYAVSGTAENILKEAERRGWTLGEVRLLSKNLESMVQVNSERLEQSKPFTVCKIKEALP